MDLVRLLGIVLALVPVLAPPYWVIVAQSTLALSIAALGVNLLFGYTGLLSLGHAAYFGIGAYAGGFLFTFADVTAFEIYLVAGLLASTTLAMAAGAVCVRATRLFFTILTLALTQTVHAMFVGGAAFRPFKLGKGFFMIGDGGLYLPRFTMAGKEIRPGQFEVTFYYVVLAAFLLSALVLSRVVRSPFGMALRAIRDNDTRAAFVGLPVRLHRWQAFVVSGFFTGLAGALSGQIDRQVTPHQLDWLVSAELVVAVILGGSGYFWGPVIGVVVLVALEDRAAVRDLPRPRPRSDARRRRRVPARRPRRRWRARLEYPARGLEGAGGSAVTLAISAPALCRSSGRSPPA